MTKKTFGTPGATELKLATSQQIAQGHGGRQHAIAPTSAYNDAGKAKGGYQESKAVENQRTRKGVLRAVGDFKYPQVD